MILPQRRRCRQKVLKANRGSWRVQQCRQCALWEQVVMGSVRSDRPAQYMGSFTMPTQSSRNDMATDMRCAICSDTHELPMFMPMGMSPKRSRPLP